MKKIFIGDAFKGSVEMPETKNAYAVFHAVKKAYEREGSVPLSLLFSTKKINTLGHYQKGGAARELAELQLLIDMGAVLEFDTTEARTLKRRIELTNDSAHVHLNISKRLRLLNKKRRSRTKQAYLFWDIENFGPVGPMFTHVIEKFRIPDHRIFIAANPDSLYLKRREWEAELFDYGKRLESFNFTIVDHGKNVADDFLLNAFEQRNIRSADVFIMTYDRDLKERFETACHIGNNLYVLGK